MKKSEASRLSALKQRQLKEWVRKLDSLLAVSKKGTVHEIKEKLFQELFKREITSIKVSAVDSNLQARQYNYLHELFTSYFYNLLHSSFGPTNLQNMNSREAVVFIETISKKAKNRKEKIYKEFRKDYLV
ncbi:MAG: hypothetical protein WCX82_01210 [archaeon]